LKARLNGRALRPVHAGGLADVSARLVEAEETLRAIRSGEADVLVASGTSGVQVLGKEGAERAYRLLIESMNEGALTMTNGAMILYCNSCFAGMVKSPLEKVIGVSLARFLDPEDQEALRTALKRNNRAGAKLQVVLNANDFTKLAVQISIRPTAGIAGPRTIGIVVTDLTETRRTEDLLRALTHGVVRAQEEERGRVAIELHDGAVQLLCALMYSSQALLSSLPPTQGIARDEAEKIRDIASKAADEVDRVSRNLRPTTLDQLGLVPALRHASREFTARSGVPVKLVATKLNSRLLPDSELTLYRILQEALTNIEKHAKARYVRVRLSQAGAFAQLLISDDGTGFDPGRRRARRGGKGGLGLLGMRERALYAGGDLKMRSSQGSGTEIEITVPMTETPCDS
jgi:two-component system NarL family sensor kinase